MLEEESKALADRLVRGQVSRAEEEETTFVVQRELDALRHTYLETTHQLALANEKIRSLSLMMEETVCIVNQRKVNSYCFHFTAYFPAVINGRNLHQTRTIAAAGRNDSVFARGTS